MRPAAAPLRAHPRADRRRRAALRDPRRLGDAERDVVDRRRRQRQVRRRRAGPPARARARASATRSAALRAATPRVFLCASTRDGEEAAILDAWLRHAHRATTPRPPTARRARHRAAPPAALRRRASRWSRARGLVDRAPQRRPRRGPPDAQVWLGDSMGELSAYYLAADVAYVGGSIVPLGGQNLIEAAAAGCPILIGRHTFNFAAASDEAVRAGAARARRRLRRARRHGARAGRRRHASRSQMADAGRGFAASHRGATARSLAIIENILDRRRA